MRQTVLSLYVLVLFFGSFAQAQSQVASAWTGFGAPPPKSSLSPEDAIVMLSDENMSYLCTGTMVNACTVLTAAHCIRNSSVRVYSVKNQVNEPMLDVLVDGGGKEGTVDDYAILRVPSNVGQRTGWMQVANRDVMHFPVGAMAYVGGYRLVNNVYTYINQPAQFEYANGEVELFRISASIPNGTSGAPFWNADSNGQGYIYGVVTGNFRSSQKGAVIPPSAFYGDVMEAISTPCVK